jgi:hypothetical protein
MRLSLLASLLLCLSVPFPAGAATVKTRDGKDYSGIVEFREGKLAIKPPGAPAAILEPDQIASVEFPDNATPDAPQTVIHGLKGEYFDGLDFKTPMLIRLDPQVNFKWNRAAPDPSVPAKNYTVRWTGQIEPRYSETYKFEVGAHDSVRLWIDGKPMVDLWDKGAKKKSGKVALQAHHKYDLKLEYRQTDKQAIVRLYWSSPSQPRWVVPTTALTPPPLPAGQKVPDWMRPNAVHGLKAQYFTGKNLTNPALLRIDPEIDFDWGNKAPVGLATDFSARWTGEVEPTLSGSYEFSFDIGSGGRLWVDNKLLAEQWKNIHPTLLNGKIELQAGRRYPIKLEMRNSAGNLKARLYWQGPRFPRQIIPTDHLYLPESEAVTTIATPGDGDAFTTPAEIPFTARVDAPAGPSVRRVEYSLGARILGAATVPPYRFVWKNPPTGRYAVSAVATLSNHQFAPSVPLDITVADKDPGTLRQPWQVHWMGGAKHEAPHQHAGVFTLAARLGRLWATRDTFQFVSQPLDGDGDLVARVTALASEDPNATAYGGIMVRDALDEGAPFVGAVVGSTGRVAFMHRDKRDEAAEFRESPAKLPLWLKITRRGGRFTVYTSPDGAAWTALDSATPIFDSDETLAGLAATSLTAAPITATFDHVIVSTGAPPSIADAAGALLRNSAFVPGALNAADAKTLTLAGPHHPDQPLPRDQVGRLIIRPFAQDLLARIPARTPGVLLASGDFAAGDITALDPDHVTVSSVLFGPQSFDLHANVLAICFHDLAPISGFRILTTAQLAYIVPTLTLHRDKLTVTDPVLGAHDLSPKDILSITRAP